MAEIVNLRTARKRKARAEKERTAETNRAVYGRTKAGKLADAAERARDEARLDGHRREGAAEGAADEADGNDRW